MRGLDEGIGGVGFQLTVVDERPGYPSATACGDCGQRGQDKYPANNHSARIFDALE